MASLKALLIFCLAVSAAHAKSLAEEAAHKDGSVEPMTRNVRPKADMAHERGMKEESPARSDLHKDEFEPVMPTMAAKPTHEHEGMTGGARTDEQKLEPHKMEESGHIPQAEPEPEPEAQPEPDLRSASREPSHIRPSGRQLGLSTDQHKPQEHRQSSNLPQERQQTGTQHGSTGFEPSQSFRPRSDQIPPSQQPSSAANILQSGGTEPEGASADNAFTVIAVRPVPRPLPLFRQQQFGPVGSQLPLGSLDSLQRQRFGSPQFGQPLQFGTPLRTQFSPLGPGQRGQQPLQGATIIHYDSDEFDYDSSNSDEFDIILPAAPPPNRPFIGSGPGLPPTARVKREAAENPEKSSLSEEEQKNSVPDKMDAGDKSKANQEDKMKSSPETRTMNAKRRMSESQKTTSREPDVSQIAPEDAPGADRDDIDGLSIIRLPTIVRYPPFFRPYSSFDDVSSGFGEPAFPTIFRRPLVRPVPVFVLPFPGDDAGTESELPMEEQSTGHMARHDHGDEKPFEQIKPNEAVVNFKLGSDAARMKLVFPQGRGKYEVRDGTGWSRTADFNVDEQGNFTLIDSKESMDAPRDRMLSFSFGGVTMDLSLCGPSDSEF